jgi:hypothetical protein
MRLHRVCLAACLVVGAFVTSSRADLQEYTLTFDIPGLTPGQSIPQSYGDTDLVDVGHRRVDVFGEFALVVADNLQWYSTGFGTLENVAWGGEEGSFDEYVAEFSFTATSPLGYVTLHSFDLAGFEDYAFPLSEKVSVYAVSDDGWGDPVWSDTVPIPNDGFVTVDLSHLNITSRELRLQWNFPQVVAIDNIRFSAVPEPASIVAWLMGGACLGFWGYRRRRAASAA